MNQPYSPKGKTRSLTSEEAKLAYGALNRIVYHITSGFAYREEATENRRSWMDSFIHPARAHVKSILRALSPLDVEELQCAAAVDIQACVERRGRSEVVARLIGIDA